jgi:SAM-dependent methyltransferase
MEEQEYLAVNKESWNERTDFHVASEFYDLKGFLEGTEPLNSIELDLLGDVRGKELLHLQCHFGMDTLSLARRGAKVTGLDFSEKAIGHAREIAGKMNIPADFVCADLYSAPNHIPKKFDVVFTSYGTIGWLPDMDRWAMVVSHFLKPGGIFVFAEFHPVVWMFDNDFTHIQYRYLKSEPIVETEEGTYAHRDAPLIKKTISWNHGMAEVIQALISAGLRIEQLQEFDYSPYDCFRPIEKIGERKYRIKGLEDKIPMVYALKARK